MVFLRNCELFLMKNFSVDFAHQTLRSRQIFFWKAWAATQVVTKLYQMATQHKRSVSMWVFPKILGKPPNHYFHHPFWVPLFLETSMSRYLQYIHWSTKYFDDWLSPQCHNGKLFISSFLRNPLTMSNAKSHVTALFLFYQENVRVLTSIYQNPAGTILACIRASPRNFGLTLKHQIPRILHPTSGPKPSLLSVNLRQARRRCWVKF